MSPEQLKQGSYDGRADVFSLGVCLYYGATGRHPFDGDNEIDVMKAVLSGDFPAPSSLVDGFPPQLETILQAALHPDPGQRTPNAQAFHEQLEDFVRTGEYASSHKALSAWLTGLFPDFDSALARQPVTPPLSGPGSVSNSEVYLSPSGTPISKQYRRFTPANRTALSPGIDIPVEVRADPTPAWKTLGMGAAGAVVVMLSLAAVLGRWGSSAKVTPVPAPVAVSAPVNPPVNAPAASPPSPTAEVATAAASIEAADPTPTSTTMTTPAAARPAGRSPAGSWRSPQATTKSAPPSPAHGQTAPSPPAPPAPTPTWTPDSPLPPP
jgi:serine/threonine-protein kinase